MTDKPRAESTVKLLRLIGLVAIVGALIVVAGAFAADPAMAPLAALIALGPLAFAVIFYAAARAIELLAEIARHLARRP